ncbi:sulfite oxidase subunit YedZ [Escherichia coli]|uniref:Sulfite oxidase subunit YedZ n=1 Tax=Escherichia coli TaxID=562 RepID=A0A2X3K976_ECOLX|nr:sulfite oxidase subunit YedZ [Escherichia coli]
MTGCRSGERYSAFYRSHCTEIFAGDLVNHTSLARYAKQPLLIRTRRLLGLWCFAWATLHLTSYALLELGVNNLALLGKELITRPYLTLGIISWVILLALAFTSTQAMQRKLGKHWQQLHNFVYLVAILAPIHYLWSVKIISPQPLIYAGLAVLLLALRYKKLRSLFNRLRKQVHNKLSV